LIDFDNLSAFIRALWLLPLIHLSLAHALGNLAALSAISLIALVASLAQANGLRLLKKFGAGLFVAWPLCGWRQLLIANSEPVVGFSGLVHAAAALLATLLLMSALTRLWAQSSQLSSRLLLSHSFKRLALEAFVGLCLLSGLLAKLLFEKAWLEPVVWSADWGFAVAQISHLDGAGVGLVVGLVMALRGNRLD
jgi:membrane associated rhomboid family serine protease